MFFFLSLEKTYCACEFGMYKTDRNPNTITLYNINVRFFFGLTKSFMGHDKMQYDMFRVWPQGRILRITVEVQWNDTPKTCTYLVGALPKLDFFELVRWLDCLILDSLQKSYTYLNIFHGMYTRIVLKIELWKLVNDHTTKIDSNIYKNDVYDVNGKLKNKNRPI